jgi:hypothetical protein
MKGCHSCETAAAIAEGKYAGKAWKDTPCAGCDVMSGSGFAIEFDEGRLGKTEGHHHEGHEAPEGGEELLPVSVMQEIMVGLLKLKPELRDVVAWRYAGMKYDDIALVQGVTRAGVEKRHRRAMELWPALKSLFPRKIGKQLVRKPHRRKGD